MAQASNIKRALFALGFAGLVGVVTTSEASAFHFGGGGGGGHMSVPHFGGGGFGGGHQSFAHVGGGGHFGGGAHFAGGGHYGGGAHFAGGGHYGGGHYGGGNHFGGGHYGGGNHYASNHGGRPHGSTYGGSHAHVAGHHLPQRDKWAHNHGPHWPQVGSRCGRWHNHGCGGYYAGGPSYNPGDDTPTYDGGDAPVPVYTAPPVQEPVSVPVPVAAPVSRPLVSGPPVSAPAKTCEAGGTFITVVFQPTATTTSITAFLKEYDVTMADGPSADGMYRIKISPETAAPGQFDQMIGSMRSKKDVVVSIES